MRLIPDAVWIGGGVHSLTPEQLTRLRAAVADGLHGPWLEQILSDLKSEGYLVGDQTLKRVPAGYPPQHPRAELLRYTNVNAIAEVSPPPAELESAAFVDWCMQHFARTKPLVDWLAEQVG